MSKIVKILMIGSSYCFYYCDELYAMAHADGVEMKIGNLYINGGMIRQHYDQLTLNEPVYWYIVNDCNGRNRQMQYVIQDALAAEDWDIVTNQESYHPGYGILNPLDNAKTCHYAKLMFDYCKERFPNAKHYWHAVWAKEVGFMGPPTPENRANNYANVEEIYQVRNKEKQTLSYEMIRDNSKQVCEENGVEAIPTGLAWQIAREDPRVGDTLCMATDKTHDGEEEGGQYLNACVWYETLTGNSCIGNTWRPDYALPEEKLLAIQECAHKAVQLFRKEGFAN